MEKKTIYNIIYYATVLIVLTALPTLTACFFKGSVESFEDAALVMIIVLTVMLLTAAVLMRFSTFRFYVDPFAALEVVLSIYLADLLLALIRTGDILAAFKETGEIRAFTLVYYALAFVFGLILSFSIKRKSGKSISYRIIGKMSKPYNFNNKEPVLD